MAHPGGRPLTYTPQIGEEICNAIATYPLGIEKLIEKFPHFPHKQTIFEWRMKIKEFGDLYTQAKKNQVENFVDEIVTISDGDDSEDDMVKINRARLKVDTRKWIAARLAPKLYGDKVENTVVVDEESIKRIRESNDKYEF